MNLGKLLAAGKSIMGGRGGIIYRIDKRVCLPKFTSAKNPFQPPAGTGSATAVGGVVAMPIADKVALAAAKTQKIPTLPDGASRPVSWVGKLNPVSLWRGAPLPDKPPVQAELSLDSVKVIHNDLSDVDVEVVPIKSRTVQEAPVPVLPPAKKSWEILGERLFKMEGTV